MPTLNEMGEHRKEVSKEKMEGRMQVQESVIATEPVPPPVNVVCARNPSVCHRSLLPVPVAGFDVIHEERQRRMSWPQSGKAWQDHSEGWKIGAGWTDGNDSLAGKGKVKKEAKRFSSTTGESRKDGKSQRWQDVKQALCRRSSRSRGRPSTTARRSPRRGIGLERKNRQPTTNNKQQTMGNPQRHEPRWSYLIWTKFQHV